MLRRFTPRNDRAFTLAEVLITLVIIGVIAALTIPNLMQKYTEQATVKKVQKFYSTLSNAYSLAMKENGTIDEWGLTGNSSESAEKIYEMLFKPYFKISKDCGRNNKGKCITNLQYKLLDNSDTESYGTNGIYYKIALEDGATAWFRGDSQRSTSFAVFYDVNGIKEPNQWGKDLFYFSIINDKVYPSGTDRSYFPFNTYCKKTTTGYGYGCAAWLIYKGNMDYLHCTGLKWTSRSCKEK